MKRIFAWLALTLVALAIGCFLGMAMATVEAQVKVADLPVGGWSEIAGTEIREIRALRLVILDPESGKPAIILRTVQGQPVIILLRPGETEAEGVLDFQAGISSAPRSVVGGGR